MAATATTTDNSKISNSNTNLTNSVSNLAVEKYTTGHKVAVGSHKVEVVRYLTEGGFAQIYIVKFIELLNEFNANAHNSELKVGDLACLKRVMVHDENGLSEMRNEVEVMKLLKGKPNVVQYYDSNATRNHSNGGNGFEVLLLMELCPNKSLLDFMNDRLATKLSEKEILKIMYDISIGIAQLHYLDTPLIHRDIKIENVLVDSQNNFKLCDFGSTSKCPTIPVTAQDIAMLSQDIYVHTTPQYRAPEMIDLYRYLPVNEKSDIWALGVFLYKLLFYTTPFERSGQFSILHSKFDIPRCNYSTQLINMIVIMLCENPYMRPNIYQVVYGICSILNIEVPISDKFGKGPYNFDRFINYQKKTQTLQQQLIAQGMEQDQEGVDKESLDVVNDMYLAYFELAPRVNDPNSTHPQLDQSVQSRGSRARSTASEEKLSRHTTRTVDSSKSAPSSNQLESNVDNDQINFNGTVNYPQSNGSNGNNNNPYRNMTEQNNFVVNEAYSTVTLPQKPTETQNYNPSNNNFLSVSNTDSVVTPHRQKSESSYASSGKSNVMMDFDGSKNNNNNNTTQMFIPEQEQMTTSGKQHKSNNPFPNMKSEGPSSTVNVTNSTDNKRTDNNVLETNIFASPQDVIINPPVIQQQQRFQQQEQYQQHQVPIPLPLPPQQQQQQQQPKQLVNNENVPRSQIPPVQHYIVPEPQPIPNILYSKNMNPITNDVSGKVDVNMKPNLPTNPRQMAPTTGPTPSATPHTIFPPPIVTQHPQNYESIHSAPYNGHASPFFIDSTVETPLKLGRHSSTKKSSNPFPYTPNVNMGPSSVLSNTTNKSKVPLHDTPSKLPQNIGPQIDNREGKLIDISPEVRREYATSIIDEVNDVGDNNDLDSESEQRRPKSNEDQRNVEDDDMSSDDPSISDLKKPKPPMRPLQFSLNEMNLSQESSLNSGALGSTMDMEEVEDVSDESELTRNRIHDRVKGGKKNNRDREVDLPDVKQIIPSIASSESIQMNLDERKRDKENRDNKNGSLENNSTGNQNDNGSSDKGNKVLLRNRSDLTRDLRQNRHSLDLELQEVNFSTQRLSPFSVSSENIKKTHSNSGNGSSITMNSTPLSFSSNSHGVSGSSLSVESIDDPRNARMSHHNHHHNHHHNNNPHQHSNHQPYSSRRNVRETRSNNAFAHVRQSLDMERIRKETLLGGSSNNVSSSGINSKRKSFFSIFKSDKN